MSEPDFPSLADKRLSWVGSSPPPQVNSRKQKTIVSHPELGAPGDRTSCHRRAGEGKG